MASSGTPTRLTLCIANGEHGPTSPSCGDLRLGHGIDHTQTEWKPRVLGRSPTSHTLSLQGGTLILHDLKWTPVRLPVPPSVHCQLGTWPVFSLLWGPAARTRQRSHPSRIEAQRLGKVSLQSCFESEGWNVVFTWLQVGPCQAYSVLCQWGSWPHFSLPWGPAARTWHQLHLHGIKALGLAETPDQLQCMSTGWNIGSKWPQVDPHQTLFIANREVGPTSASHGDLWPGPCVNCTPMESKPGVLGRSPTSHTLSLKGGMWIPLSLEWAPIRLTLCIANGEVGPTSPSHVDLWLGPSSNHTPAESKPGIMARSPTSHALSPRGGTLNLCGLE